MSDEKPVQMDHTTMSLSMLAAEDFLRDFATGGAKRSAEILLESRADHGEGLPFALALIAERAVLDAAEQRGMSFEQYLRGLCSWILQHHALNDEAGGDA